MTTACAPQIQAPDEPYRTVGRLLKQVTSSVIRGIDQRMQPYGLTAMQWEPMFLVASGKVDTVAALARESHVNCGAMTRMLDRLEKKQLLRRRRSDSDRRVVHLELTPKGRRLVHRILPVALEELRQHLKDFKPEEIEMLISLLGRMLRNGVHDA